MGELLWNWTKGYIENGVFVRKQRNICTYLKFVVIQWCNSRTPDLHRRHSGSRRVHFEQQVQDILKHQRRKSIFIKPRVLRSAVYCKFWVTFCSLISADLVQMTWNFQKTCAKLSSKPVCKNHDHERLFTAVELFQTAIF